MIEYLHCIVDNRVLEEEPEDTVIWFCMNALLLKKTDLIGLSRKDIKLQHLNERVTVLWSELNRELEEVLGLCVIEMFVVPKVGHGKASSFAPDLTGLGNLLQSLIERMEHLLKVFLGEGTGVL